MPAVGVVHPGPVHYRRAYYHFPTVYADEPTIIGNLEYPISYFGMTLPYEIVVGPAGWRHR